MQTKFSFNSAAIVFVFEALVLHHMAPMAGRVADRKKDRFVFVASALQRLFTPRIPIHGVLGVLQEVGTGFVSEAIGHDQARMFVFG